MGSRGSRVFIGTNFGRKRSTTACSGMSTPSTVWDRMNPSRQTIIGSMTRWSSAMRKAWMVMSSASWLSSTYTWSQPLSRTGCESLCSVQMPEAAPRLRLATAMTTGRRFGAAAKSISYIRARPCEEVAVKVRTPPADAPTATDITECSLSAGDEVGVHHAVVDELGDLLDDDRLRGDGESGHDLRPGEHGAVGHRHVPDDRPHCHVCTPWIMSMASTGQMSAQMPQPLQ